MTAKLRDGASAHRLLPAPLERTRRRRPLHRRPGAARRAQGAAAARRRLDVRVAGLSGGRSWTSLAEPLELGGEIDVTVTDLNVTNDVLDRLPEDLHYVKTDYAPSGPATVSTAYRKAAPGSAAGARVALEAKGMAGCLHTFPYPFQDVHGTMRIDASQAPVATSPWI